MNTTSQPIGQLIARLDTIWSGLSVCQGEAEQKLKAARLRAHQEYNKEIAQAVQQFRQELEEASSGIVVYMVNLRAIAHAIGQSTMPRACTFRLLEALVRELDNMLGGIRSGCRRDIKRRVSCRHIVEEDLLYKGFAGDREVLEWRATHPGETSPALFINHLLQEAVKQVGVEGVRVHTTMYERSNKLYLDMTATLR